MCQFPDMEITLDNFANHLFPASLKALSFLERFYPCSQQNARNKVFFYFKLAVKMHMYYREIKKQNLMHVFQSVTWEHKTTFEEENTILFCWLVLYVFSSISPLNPWGQKPGFQMLIHVLDFNPD